MTRGPQRRMQGWCTRCSVRIASVCTLVREKGDNGVREKEHQRDVRPLEEVRFTWARKKDSVSEVHLSAITDHVARNNNHTKD